MMKRAMMCAAAVVAGVIGVAGAQPVETVWPVQTPVTVSAVASSPLAGWYAVADTGDDTVEIRDAAGVLRRTLTAAELEPGGPVRGFPGAEGPVALAFSDTGLALYVALKTDVLPAADVIRRYDVGTGLMTTFATVDLGQTTSPTGVSLAFHAARLYVGSPFGLRVYRALSTDGSGPLLNSFALGGVTALAIDRDQSNVFLNLGGTLLRSPTASIALSVVGATGAANAMAWHDHYGSGFGTTAPGLFVLTGGGATVMHVPAAQARGTAAFSPSTYTTLSPAAAGLAATADGGLLGHRTGGAFVMRDGSDLRLGLTAWMNNEFAQTVAFARSLMTPNLAPGTPAGWVIDADVQIGWTRFHPATPDAAAWTVMLLLMNDELTGDAAAQADVRMILQRYAGLSPGGIGPSRTADGIFRHWIDPMTGGVKAGWDPEYATLSTMKMVHAAARAWARYPNDASIEASARAIICGVQNWDSYFRNSGTQLAFKGLEGGGPDGDSWSGGWHEGMLFAEQAGAYGGAGGDVAASRWTSPGGWPTVSSYAGLQVTGGSSGQYQATFLTGYANLWSVPFRASAAWRFHTLGLRLAQQAWTDDNAPRFATVFSAGTTKSEWGGYNADSLSNHPGNVTTFPSMMAFAGRVATASESPLAEVVGAYQAYRRGARQTWLGGASLLYRRSAVDVAYSPNSAGLPDVALGALGLAELISPGSVGVVLAGTYPSCGCPADWDGDGDVDSDDIVQFFGAWEMGEGDVDGDDDTDSDDVVMFFERWDSGC